MNSSHGFGLDRDSSNNRDLLNCSIRSDKVQSKMRPENKLELKKRSSMSPRPNASPTSPQKESLRDKRNSAKKSSEDQDEISILESPLAVKEAIPVDETANEDRGTL